MPFLPAWRYAMKWHRLLISVSLLGAVAFAQGFRPNPDEGTPLLNTAQSLQAARSRILEARPEAAAAALRMAAQHLAAFEVLFPGPQAEHAEYIRQQILEQTARMNDGAYALIDRIDYLWLAPVEDWCNRAGR
jgi:hypothetical protein